MRTMNALSAKRPRRGTHLWVPGDRTHRQECQCAHAVAVPGGPLLDDHPMMRQGLCQLIEAEPDLSVCGEAETAGNAFEAIAALKPDLVLADISLPDKNGLELIKDVQSVAPGLPVLVISMHDESLY